MSASAPCERCPSSSRLMTTAGVHVDALDGRAGELVVAHAGVVGDPLSVGGPHVDVGEHVAPRIAGELAFGGVHRGGGEKQCKRHYTERAPRAPLGGRTLLSVLPSVPPP